MPPKKRYIYNNKHDEHKIRVKKRRTEKDNAKDKKTNFLKEQRYFIINLKLKIILCWY